MHVHARRALSLAALCLVAICGCGRDAADGPVTPKGAKAHASEDGAFSLIVSPGEICVTTPGGMDSYECANTDAPVTLDAAKGVTLAPDGNGFTYQAPAFGAVRLSPQSEAKHGH